MTQIADLLKRLAAGHLPPDLPEEGDYAEDLRELVGYLQELSQFVGAMSAGNLSASLTRSGALAGNLKG